MLTNHQKGYHRDREIMAAIENRTVMNTDQISALFFPGIKNPTRMAQKRLLSLYKRKKLYRGRDAISEPYYYYAGSKPGQVEHMLGVNWVYVWVIKTLKSWEKLHCFDAEQDYKYLRSDAFIGVKNTITGKIKFTFLELDLSTSWNDFDKVEKYNKLYLSDDYLASWWANVADKFPVIMSVTDDQRRAEMITRKIKKNNTEGLDFKVNLLSIIKEECLNA